MLSAFEEGAEKNAVIVPVRPEFYLIEKRLSEIGFARQPAKPFQADPANRSQPACFGRNPAVFRSSPFITTIASIPGLERDRQGNLNQRPILAGATSKNIDD